MPINTGTLITQGLLLALELYRNHNNLAPDWVPSEDDWDQLEAEVELMTAQKFKEEAVASLPPKDPEPEPAPTPVAEIDHTSEGIGVGTQPPPPDTVP